MTSIKVNAHRKRSSTHDAVTKDDKHASQTDYTNFDIKVRKNCALDCLLCRQGPANRARRILWTAGWSVLQPFCPNN